MQRQLRRELCKEQSVTLSGSDTALVGESSERSVSMLLAAAVFSVIALTTEHRFDCGGIVTSLEISLLSKV